MGTDDGEYQFDDAEQPRTDPDYTDTVIRRRHVYHRVTVPRAFQVVIVQTADQFQTRIQTLVSSSSFFSSSSRFDLIRYCFPLGFSADVDERTVLGDHRISGNNRIRSNRIAIPFRDRPCDVDGQSRVSGRVVGDADEHPRVQSIFQTSAIQRQRCLVLDGRPGGIVGRAVPGRLPGWLDPIEGRDRVAICGAFQTTGSGAEFRFDVTERRRVTAEVVLQR